MKHKEYEEAIKRAMVEGSGWVKVEIVDPYVRLPWYRRFWLWLTN